MPTQTFFSSGTFNVPEGVDEVDVLVVGGGGGGGSSGGGGGGGGGGAVVWQTGVSVTPEGTVSVTVGSGGAGITSGNTDHGGDGGQSAFGAVTAAGGGGGGGGNNGAPNSGRNGRDGACGGGGQRQGVGGSGSVGGDGGDGFESGTTTQRAAGGGGGMGGNGTNATSNTGGAGGPGVDMSTEVGAGIGESGWFGAGGGGGRNASGNASGGQGGGGNGGALEGNGTNAQANTGSGGGGAGGNGTGAGGPAGNGGNGAAGIVHVVWEGAEPVDPEIPVQISGASAANVSSPADRAVKSQHWAWWNGFHGRWDAVLPSSGGNGWRIFTGVDSSPIASTSVDTRQAARVDVFFEPSQGARGRLYVAAGHTSQSRFSRYDLQANGSYTLVGSVVSLPSGLNASNGDASPLLMYRTPNGTIWLTRVPGSNVVVTRSTNGGASFESTVNLMSSSSSTGVALPIHVGSQFLVFVSLNDGAGRSVRRISQSAGSISAGNWTTESLPGLSGGVTSDDHGHIVQVGGHVYVCSKTTGSSGGGTAVLYLQHRDADGTWSSPITVRPGPDDGETRPSLVVAGENLRYTFTDFTSPFEGQAVTIPRDSLSPGSPGVLFDTGQIDDGIVPPRTATPTSGILWLAHNRSNGSIWRLKETVPGGEGSGMWLITSGAPVALSPHLITSGSPAGLVPHIIS